MSTTNSGPAITTQNQQVAATGNMSNEWILLVTPALTTSIPANSSAEVTVNVSGLQLNDFIEINKTTHVAGLSIGNARVSAVGVLSIQMVNSTAAPISLLVGDTYLVSVERPMAQYVINGLPSGIPV